MRLSESYDLVGAISVKGRQVGTHGGKERTAFALPELLKSPAIFFARSGHENHNFFLILKRVREFVDCTDSTRDHPHHNHILT